MWGPLYLTVLVLAGALTWGFAIREEAVVFTSAFASVLWAFLSLVAEVSVADGGAVVDVTVGPIRWVWAGFALVSMVALVGAVTGVYPDPTPEQDYTEVP